MNLGRMLAGVPEQSPEQLLKRDMKELAREMRSAQSDEEHMEALEAYLKLRERLHEMNEREEED